MPTVVALLKTPDHGAYAEGHGGRLPYGIDLLEDHGFVLRSTDAHLCGFWVRRPVAGLVRKVERATTAILQTILLGPQIARAPITLAMFESEGHFLALLRGWCKMAHIPRRRRRQLVIIACWLAELCENATPAALARYRRLYRNVDRVIVFSANQRALLAASLGIPQERIAVVPFGIDGRDLAASGLMDRVDAMDGSSDDGSVLAVGRDMGRDWPTFFAAVAHSGWPVNVVCRPHLLEGLAIPDGTRLLGEVDRATYLGMLRRARVVVIATRDLAYPTGQSVLIEAMRLGKACVVTDTAAMADYVRGGRTCLVTPVGDALALRDAIGRLLSDDSLRLRVGESARTESAARFDAKVMWAEVSKVLARLAHGED